MCRKIRKKHSQNDHLNIETNSKYARDGMTIYYTLSDSRARCGFDDENKI